MFSRSRPLLEVKDVGVLGWRLFGGMADEITTQCRMTMMGKSPSFTTTRRRGRSGHQQDGDILFGRRLRILKWLVD